MALATRRSYAGAAPACTLSSDIAAGATSFSITGTTTNWPTTATGPFYMVIDPGLSTEEKVLVGARTSGSLSSVTRGVDGTTAASHVTGATCYPVFTAVDANDANLLASRLSAKGDLISSDGTDPTKVAVGSNNTRLVADSAQTSGIKWVADTQNTVIDAKGDLLVGSAADTVARLAVDTTDGAVLIADSTATNGVSWQANNIGVRNLVYNGAMQVAQRGTSTASITTSNYYTADRWQHGVETLGTWTSSIENDAPTGSGFRKSLKMLCTTADASPAASDNVGVQQNLEGQDLQSIRKGTSSAKQLTLSFWVKSNVTGTYIAELYDFDNTRQASKSYTISASATWEFKTLTFNADTTGAFDNDNAASLLVKFWLGAGSTFTSGTLNTSWGSSTAANRAVGQVNLASATNNYWQVTGVQLNVGPVAAPFEFKSYGQELAECQRYYQLLLSGTNKPIGVVTYTNSTTFEGCFFLTTEMRTAPSMASQTTNGTSYYVCLSAGGGYDYVNYVYLDSIKSGRAVFLYNNSEASGTQGQAGLWYSSNASAVVALDAEL